MRSPPAARIGLLLLFVAVASILLGTVAARPRCRVTIATVRVSREAAGVRHATLQILNAGRRPVEVFPSYALQNRSGGWRPDLIPPKALAGGTNMVGILPSGEKILAPGESLTVTLELPFDGHGWRARISYIPLMPQWRVFLSHALARIGLSLDWPALDVYSDWASE